MVFCRRCFKWFQDSFLESNVYYVANNENWKQFHSVGGEPAHHCKVPTGQSVNTTIPVTVDKRGRETFKQCEKYVNFSHSNETEPCGEAGWYYEPEYESTLVTEVIN